MLDIFDILGPIMVGPSSSHTAGAVRIGNMIETKDLAYTYPASEEGGKPTAALRGVDLKIEPGSFVVILGHNGSGKSTLAKTFNAVLLPVCGKVYVEGMDTLDEGLLLAIRQRVGMVFQNPDNQIVANVVEEDVAFAPENLGVPTEEIRRRVDDALAAVGMVRAITGTVLYAAEGKLAPEDIPGILERGDRSAAGPTAPPGGLYLTRLWYEDERLNE